MRRVDDAIMLPEGLQLEDASNYITKLPKAEHTAVEWQVGG